MIYSPSTYAYLLTFGLIVSCVGCAAEVQRLPIEGEITFKGEAVNEGSIMFHPLNPEVGFVEGALIKEGRYKILAQNGLLQGKYQVMVSAADFKGKKPDPNVAPGAIFQSKELFPEIYNTKSTLAVEVKKEGPNKFDFHLK